MQVVDQFTPMYQYTPTRKFIQNHHSYTIITYVYDQIDHYGWCVDQVSVRSPIAFEKLMDTMARDRWTDVGNIFSMKKVQIFEKIEGGHELVHHHYLLS